MCPQFVEPESHQGDGVATGDWGESIVQRYAGFHQEGTT